MKLSACLIVRNEADALPRCLSALREHVFELVVVDTGSNDETPIIAEQMGANVVTLPWQDDFSAARNAALDEATGDWCLMVDADEIVQPSGWPLLDAFMADGAHAHGNMTIVSDTTEGRVHSAIRRLCRNDKTGWAQPATRAPSSSAAGSLSRLRMAGILGLAEQAFEAAPERCIERSIQLRSDGMKWLFVLRWARNAGTFCGWWFVRG